MSKKISILILVLLALIIRTGCARDIEELKQLDEDEFYIYEEGKVAFEIEEYSDDRTSFLYPSGNTHVVHFSDFDENLQTKRGIGIGSDVLEVIEAYQGTYCYTAVNDRKNEMPRQYTKFHEIGMLYDKMTWLRRVLPKYAERDYFVEYDYYILGDKVLSLDGLDAFLDEKEISYYELIFDMHKYHFGMTRRYIRFLFEDDRVKDVWVYFTHDYKER